MDVTLGSGGPWSGSSGFPSQPVLFNDATYAAGSNAVLPMVPQAGAVPTAAAVGVAPAGAGTLPAGPPLWNVPSLPAERGEFAQGFLWFDAVPGAGYGVGGLKAEDSSAWAVPGAAQPLPATQPPFQQAAGMMYPQPQHHIVVEQLQPGQGLVPVAQLHGGAQQAAAAQAAAAPAATQASDGPPAGQPAGRGRKGGRARAVSSEEERKARNRATQARFRERQKAKNDALLAQHAAAEGELQRERGEQAALQAQQEVLQKMLLVRDGALAALGAAPPPDGAPAAPTVPPARLAGLSAPAATPPELGPPAAGSSAAPALSRGSGGDDGDASSRGAPPRTASGGAAGLSSSIQEHMEWLGRELTAQMAMLELPATADPDELMALAHAQLAAATSDGGAPHALPPPRPPPLEAPLHPSNSASTSLLAGGPANSSSSLSPQASAGSGGGAASSSGAGSASTRGAPQPIGLAALFREKPDLVARCREMSGEEFVADWVDKARAFRELLAVYDREGGEETLEQILDIFRAWGGTLSLTLHLRPENAQVLFATAANAPPGTWEATAESLKPTRAQRVMLRQLWHAYAGSTQAIRAERAAAMAAVHQAAAAAHVTPDTLPADTLGNLMSRYLSLFDAAGRVASLRDAEFIAMLQLMGRVGAVFSPVQKARSVAACYPHFPDVVQIVRHLATDQGQAAGEAGAELLR